MKNRLKHLLLLFALLVATTANAQQEEILSYHSDIKADTTSTIFVTETIRIYANGDKIQRGIYRNLPATRNINDRTTPVSYDIISVKKNGKEEKYHIKSASGSYLIYVGDEDIYLKPGEYVYEIKYTASDQIGFFDNYDELYWNVNGNNWDFPIAEISATVTLPDRASVVQQNCYTGSYGNTAQNCEAEKLSENVLKWKATGLYPNEGLTIAVGFTKGVIAPPAPPGFFKLYGIAILLFFILLGLCIYFYRSWRKHGVDPPSPTVYPQFNVPENLSPASVGMLNDEFYNKRILTASLVSLATKGYVHIEQKDSKNLGIFKKTSFVLKKLKEPTNELPPEENTLLEHLFKHSNPVTLDGEYNTNIKSAVDAFEKVVSKKHEALIRKGSNTNLLVLPAIVILLTFIAVQRYLTYIADDSALPFTITAFLVTAGIIMFVVVAYLLDRYSWFRWVAFFLCLIVFMIFAGIVLTDKQRIFNINYYASLGFFILAFIAICVFCYFVKRPSEEKLRIQSLIDGFKMYMGAAEERQLQHFNPPQITPEIFESLLPFAMVLGVDKIWGEKFQHVLMNSATEGATYSSGWYSGKSFSPAMMGGSLNSALTNSFASSSTQPSSSGSGSGGGGFSGGGGGGGGGGGW